MEFRNATYQIYRDLFKVFYPVCGEFPVTYARSTDVRVEVGDSEKTKDFITAEEIEALADEFASALPEGEFSPAQIQGKLRRWFPLK